jgi:ribonuclease H2 subunit A
LDWLSKNGANDSKQLTEEVRESFFQKVLTNNTTMGWRAALLHPEHISNCMMRREKFNLNELSYATVFSLINGLLEAGVHIKSAFVDTLGKPEKYEALLTSRFGGIKFTVRSKADSLFPVVGAASIVAKVLRDDVLKASGIAASGYPGDAATVAWLRGNVHPVFGFPRIVRFSWSSCAGLLQERCCKVIWLDHADEDNANKENKRKLTMGKKIGIASPFGLSPLFSLF